MGRKIRVTTQIDVKIKKRPLDADNGFAPWVAPWLQAEFAFVL